MAQKTVREFWTLGRAGVTQIDSALKRLFVMLFLANLVLFVKLLIEGHLVSKILVGIIVVVSLGVAIASAFIKTISMGIIADNELELNFDPRYKLHWWNFYKHPLTARFRPKLNASQAEKCKWIVTPRV